MQRQADKQEFSKGCKLITSYTGNHQDSFPPNPDLHPFSDWDSLDNFTVIEKMTLSEIVDRYDLDKEQKDKIVAYINSLKP